MAGMYALSSHSRPSHQARVRPQIEIDLENTLDRMMSAIGNGDMTTYKQIVNVEFPVKFKPRMTRSYHELLKNYIHPYNSGTFTYMTPLQAAVFSGNPDMVKEVLQLGNDMEYKSDDVIHSIIQNKTARGMADVFIANSTTPEQAAPYKVIKKILLLNGAKPKMITTMLGKKLAFPENKANVNEFMRGSTAVNGNHRKSRKSRKSRNARKNKTRRA
jgi:hypothetical protein